MGRMLEALKRAEEPTQASEPVLQPAFSELEVEESDEVEMPFIEVGGPRAAPSPLVTGAGNSLRTPQQESPAQPASAPFVPTAKAKGWSAPRLDVPGPRGAILQIQQPLGVALKPCELVTSSAARIASELVAYHQPDHAVSKQYGALFSQLCIESADDSAPALLFTSLTPGAGTTTSVLNLAIAGCRQSTRRIVVVDANHPRPAVATRLGVTTTNGLCDVLRGKVALEQAVHGTPVKDLYVLAAATKSETDAIAADAIRWVLTWLRQRYDLVLVDAPAWDSGENISGLVAAASVIYLVVDATEATKPAVRAVTREAARLGSRCGGLIVTQ